MASAPPYEPANHPVAIEIGPRYPAPNGINDASICALPGLFGQAGGAPIGVISEYENTLIWAPIPGAVTMLLRPDKKSTNPAARLTPDVSLRTVRRLRTLPVSCREAEARC